MTITIWQASEVFTCRVYKRLTNRPDVLWANSYELFAVSGNTDGATAAKQAATSIAIWESQFHLTDVQFDRAVFSTLAEDGEPYQPANFAVSSLAEVVGKRTSAATDPQPLQVCLKVRRDVDYGRVGHALYRRVLNENDVQSPSGTPALAPTSRTALNAVIKGPWDGEAESPGIVELLREVYGLDLVMVGEPGSAPNVRVVNFFEADGVTIKKFNNAFYNRRTPSGPPVNPTPTP